MLTPPIDDIGRLLGDRSRATMIAALLDGRAWTGRDLAAVAHVTPSTASEHLQRLVDGALLRAVKHGTHRYYRIASPSVAQLLEAMMAVAPPGTADAKLRPRIDAGLRRARTCYDHIAGELGVAIFDALVRLGVITLDKYGESVAAVDGNFFARLGIAPQAAASRPFCRLCLDWTERKFHVGGRLGAALARHAFERQWLQRHERHRTLTISPAGAAALSDLFALRWEEEGSP